jgi:outer membrane protein insertion porin family
MENRMVAIQGFGTARMRLECRTTWLVVALVWISVARGNAPTPPQGLTTPLYRTQSPEPAGFRPPAAVLPRAPEAAKPAVGEVTPPHGPVLSVSITGNKTVKETEIRRHIKTLKDRTYDAQLVQEDLRRLFATRKFHNVRVHHRLDAGGVHVTFEVLERPMIGEVLFIGNRYFNNKKLLKESGLAEGDALNVYTIQEARRKLEEFYHSKGFAKTTVSIEEGDQPSDRRVVLRIDEGRVERIWTVRFVGNDPSLVSDGRLKFLIKSKPGFAKYLFGGKVDFTTIEQDRQTLIAYYRGLGFFRARVSRELEYDASGQWLTLTFVIDQGPRYLIQDLSIVGNQKFDTQELLGHLKLQSGDYFNLEKMQLDENALREIYGGHGHIFADIKASPRFLEEPGRLNLVYQIEEGEVFRVGRINVHVAGEYANTRQNVILNRLSLRPGDIIDIREVRASERRLTASSLFITNPAEGSPPRIVIRPPDLAEAASMAQQGRTYRGQSPDAPDGAPAERLMVLDVLVPPLENGPR